MKGGLSAQPRLIVMGGPVGAELPLIFGLALGQIVADFDLVKARPAGHGVLIGDHMATGAQAPIIPQQPATAALW